MFPGFEGYSIISLSVFAVFFICYALIAKRRNKQLFLFFFSKLLFLLVFFLIQDVNRFNFFLSASFFYLYFLFLFCLLEVFGEIFAFSFLFEFILNVAIFLMSLLFSFCTALMSFNLFFLILASLVFFINRLLYLWLKHVLDQYFNTNYFSNFLVQWSYICCLSVLNLAFFLVFLYCCRFDFLLLFSFLTGGIYSFLGFLFGVFCVPYFVYLLDYMVEDVFSRVFSVASSYSARARTFKVSVKWVVRVFCGFVYLIIWLSFLDVNISTISWNLSLLVAFGSLGFKGVIDDFINGICVLFEDSVNIGEFIETANVSGRVEEVTLRVIKLRNFDGSVYVIPFRKVEIIRNRSKEFVFVIFDLILDISVDFCFVIEWMQEAFDLFKSSPETAPFLSNILEDIEIIGITSITAAGVVYEARLKIIPFNTRFVKAVYFKFLKELAMKKNIVFGFQHSILSNSVHSGVRYSKK